MTPWEDPAWRRGAAAWITGALAAHGLRPAGAPDVRVRPWSVVTRVPHTGGTAWFKANPPGSAFEPALCEALADRVPGHVLRPLAVETGRAFALMPDGGGLLRDAEDPAQWEHVLTAYAVLQRELAAHTREMADIGVPDFRPGALPGLLDARLEDPALPLTGAERAALRARSGHVRELCAELEASAVPASLDHADLHGGAVLTGAWPRPVFFDWGDACIAHPFTTLLVTSRFVRGQHGEAAVARVRDAYLEPWTDLGHTPAELRRLADAACHVGAVIRADAWNRVFVPVGAADADEHSARWLRALLPAEAA